MTPLLPCPLCGGEAKKAWCMIHCTKCWLKLEDPHADEPAHVAAWNRRHASGEVVEPVANSGFVVVPVSELERLERARQDLYALLEKECRDTGFVVRLGQVTDVLWNLANRKWPDHRSLPGDAVDVALERAAKVIDEIEVQWHKQWRAGLKCDSHLEGKMDGAGECAAAIRALKDEAMRGVGK